MKEPVINPVSSDPVTVPEKQPAAKHETVAGVKEKFTSYQKFVIVLLALLNFTIILDFMILSPLGDILMKSLNMDTLQFGSVVSAYAISAGISGFLAAGFADKFDRKKILMFFYVGFVIGTLFCGLANTYETLFAARIVTGIFGGVIGSISMAILTDIFSMQQRGQVMGFVQMAFAGSQILGIPIGLFLAEKFNWHVTFYMVVGLAMIVGAMIVIKLKPLTEHLKLQSTKNPLRHLLQTIRKPDYLTGFLATMLLSMGGFMLMPFTSAFLVNNVHIPQKDLPIIFLCTGLSSIIIMPIIGKISDKVDKFKLFAIGSLIAIAMVIIYTNLSPVPIWQVIIINMILFMGIMSRMVPATTLNSAVPGPADRGAYMSVNASLQQMAGGVAAIFAGFVVVQKDKTSPIEHFDILGYAMAGLILLCLFFVYRVSQLIKARNIK
ncbi:MAG: transporter [Bacteroidetes bacterium]|nr:transporter [Bacteroidota bacterium]